MRAIAAQFSFDVVSRVDLAEVNNAVNQAAKEISTRYDLRGSKARIDFDEKQGQLTLVAEDDFKLRAVVDILETRLVKRGVSLKALVSQKPEEAAGGMLRQVIKLQQGIPEDKARQMTKAVKASKLKVTIQIQGDQLRVSGAKKDDLQAVIALLKGEDHGLELQFVNYR